jgi:hypothetical protein
MTKRIHVTDPTVSRIRGTEGPLPRVDPQAVADALGAEPDREPLGQNPGPLTFFALRSELFRRLQSRGGRPGLEGTTFRAKIPLDQQEWKRLETLAASFSDEGFSPSPGQVASVLLSLALRTVSHELEHPGTLSSGYAALLAQELAAKRKAEKPR